MNIDDALQNPADAERILGRIKKEFARKLHARVPGHADAWEAFSALLLQPGGTHVVPLPHEPDRLFEMIGVYGDVVPNSADIEYWPSVTWDNIPNVARLWDAREVDALGLGYGLSGNGRWYRHIWAWNGDVLIETAEIHVRYFGIKYAGDGAEHLARMNDPYSP